MAGWEEYTDPRLAARYDLWGPSRPDLVFYTGLAMEQPASSVADIGCGTGVLASELARRGCLVTGVDPSPAMLDVARHRPDGERVRWIEFPDGEELASTTQLRFRNQKQLARSLTDAGFSVEQVFGDWDRRPVEPGSRELIFVAASGVDSVHERRRPLDRRGPAPLLVLRAGSDAGGQADRRARGVHLLRLRRPGP